MDDRELKRLSRAELLEMLLAQSKEIESLQEQLQTLTERADEQQKASEMQLQTANEQLKQRQIMIDEAGSIAEAALQLNGIFDAAQKAADQYLENVKALSDRQEEICARRDAESQNIADKLLAEANARCETMEMDTKTKCSIMTARAKAEADNYWQDVSAKLEEFYNAHKGLKELLSIDAFSDKSIG